MKTDHCFEQNGRTDDRLAFWESGRLPVKSIFHSDLLVYRPSYIRIVHASLFPPFKMRKKFKNVHLNQFWSYRTSSKRWTEWCQQNVWGLWVTLLRQSITLHYITFQSIQNHSWSMRIDSYSSIRTESEIRIKTDCRISDEYVLSFIHFWYKEDYSVSCRFPSALIVRKWWHWDYCLYEMRIGHKLNENSIIRHRTFWNREIRHRKPEEWQKCFVRSDNLFVITFKLHQQFRIISWQ
jgi:hypothetical protein